MYYYMMWMKWGWEAAVPSNPHQVFWVELRTHHAHGYVKVLLPSASECGLIWK